MNLRKQILFSVIGITVLAQVVFGLLSYQQITESRGDQLTVFLQYLAREVAERIMLPGDAYVSKIYLEELRKKFSTQDSILIVQENNDILYIAGNPGLDIDLISRNLNEAYADRDKHGLINMGAVQYYWATSQLSDKEYQLVMLEPAGNEETKIAATLRQRLLIFGFIILWIAVWLGVVLSSKISRQLDEKNDQLEHMALHDSLTGLPNRTLLADRLEQTLLQSTRNHLTFALCLIDLDRFKEINDTLGHYFGDELLKVVSARLFSTLRENDSIARLGGDEFAVLLPQTSLDGAELCAKRIMQAMDVPFFINDVATESKASIGIALFPEHGNNCDVLLQYADVAMYQAKKSNSGYAIYDPAQNTHSIRRLQLMNDLRYAIDNNEITVKYQPLISRQKQLTISVEALARWQHPALGNITPDEFIPMAEQMGLIRKLTLQILEQSLQDSGHWRKQGHDLGVCINLSVYSLQDISLPDEIYAVLTTHNVDTSKIEFEITESALMHDLGRARKILDKLASMGVKLAIDDFGTGFSSLNYLKNLPIDTLKIDKSFIDDMCSNTTDNAVVKTIIELGHNLGCKVVAEGVEDKATWDSLSQLNVDIVQGYLFSKPLSSDELVAWLGNPRLVLKVL